MDIMDKMDKIGILDPEGLEQNPLTKKPYSETYRDLAKIWSEFPAYEKADQIISSIRTTL